MAPQHDCTPPKAAQRHYGTKALWHNADGTMARCFGTLAHPKGHNTTAAHPKGHNSNGSLAHIAVVARWNTVRETNKLQPTKSGTNVKGHKYNTTQRHNKKLSERQFMTVSSLMMKYNILTPNQYVVIDLSREPIFKMDPTHS